MNKLTKELETITTIPEQQLLKLVEKTMFCVCQDVKESILAKEPTTEIDVGVGTLTIQVANGEVKYRFVPSAKLNDAIIKTIKEGNSPLTLVAETNLKDRIINVYKDLL